MAQPHSHESRIGRVPLWMQVLDDLRDRISNDEFRDRFPTDRELVETYEVSRHTIREAVRRLQSEGVVDRARGRGSTVTSNQIEQPIGGLYSLFRSIEDSGASQTSEVLVLERQVNAQAAAVLDRSPEEPLFYLERVRSMDGIPFAHDRAWLPLDIAEPLFGVDFSRTSLYDELRTNCGVSPDQGCESIRPVVPDRAEAVLLDMPVGTPAFEIERRTEFRGIPLEWRRTVLRGDRYVVRADWSEGMADTPTIAPG